MKSSSLKEKTCTEDSKKLFNLVVNAQKTKIDVKEIGMLQLVDEIDRLRQLWKMSEDSKLKLAEEMNQMEKALAEARKKLELFQLDMGDTRKMLRTALDENKALKLDLNVYETREKRLKDAMKGGAFDSLTKEDRDQFAFLREPLVRTYSKRIQEKHPHLMEETNESEDDSSVDYDMTNESLDEVITLRNGREVRRSSAAGGKRRSSSAHAHVHINSKRSRSRVMATPIKEEPQIEETPSKRYRDDGIQEVTTTTTTTTTTLKGGNDRRPTRTSIHRQVTRRSMSCGSVPSIEQTPGHTFAAGMSTNAALTKSTLDIRTLKRGGTSTWTTGQVNDIALRKHSFEDVGLNLKMTKCDECHQVIFANRSQKCRDCHQTVHKHCTGRLRLPCVPRQKTIATPKSANRNVKREYRLQDFCTNAKPMIPFPVVHCVVALEKRALTQEGLYRVPGSTRTVTSLLDELRTSRTVPNLDLQDCEVITETLKRFLRDLRDPLVPKTSREEFMVAANQFTTDPDQGRLSLNKVICELPQANRDTMAYLFLHWRKVVAVSEFNKMPKENMARVLAPCVMGIPTSRMDQTSATHDITNCERTLNALFTFDDGYWQRFLGPIDSIEMPRHNDLYSPPMGNVCDRSILGPVSISPATPLLTRSANPNRRLNLLGPL
ncbi:unnamed protein product [Caenorhabditis angaria]|uniref:Uncharacterized protein n=1 Tax=Caenorhabditis angaria TaxID=860376 RepID=A0A9P1N3H8_9PELO|nr:unnamed protein product [Caenorhabditis angaria]